MQLILGISDIKALSDEARNEIIGLITSIGQDEGEDWPDDLGPEYEGIDLEGVVDLTPKQITAWMSKASDKTKSGLQVIAEHGPVVKAKVLTAAGIESLRHFQSRTTLRTRTITGDGDAYMLGWDDWDEVDVGEGQYAVTPTTFRSLRSYFQLD